MSNICTDDHRRFFKTLRKLEISHNLGVSLVGGTPENLIIKKEVRGRSGSDKNDAQLQMLHVSGLWGSEYLWYMLYQCCTSEPSTVAGEAPTDVFLGVFWKNSAFSATSLLTKHNGKCVLCFKMTAA